MKYIKKIVICTFIFITIISLFPLISHASLIEDIVDDASSFLKIDDGTKDTIDGGKLEEISTTFFNALFTIGVIISVIYGLFLAINYMLSSIDEKAEAKKSLFPYVVGNIVLFGSYGIWRMAIIIGRLMNNAVK